MVYAHTGRMFPVFLLEREKAEPTVSDVVQKAKLELLTCRHIPSRTGHSNIRPNRMTFCPCPVSRKHHLTQARTFDKMAQVY